MSKPGGKISEITIMTHLPEEFLQVGLHLGLRDPQVGLVRSPY